VEDLLLAWFAEHGRDLPWRRTRDPYAILVSEVMSQQTQVERVVPRWQRWLERWPTVETLAAGAGRRRDPGVAGPRLQPARALPPPRGAARRGSRAGPKT
jgi:3-methyladenine DNA glycosylase/8-oxoguanine DNA glycosylase